MGLHRAGALCEQLHRFRGGGSGRSARSGELERVHPVDLLAGDAERLPTRREHRRIGTATKH